MKYSLEIDALNALVEAQHKTNELLEKLLGGQSNGMHQDAKGSVEHAVGGERKVYRKRDQNGTVQSGKGAGKLRQKRSS